MRQRLAIAHNLRKDKKKKPVLHAEDEFELLKTLYISTETTFSHERYRVQLALVMQLVEITSNRSSALLAIRYQHIKMTLLKNSKDEEQSRVLIEIVFNHIKGYLEEKDACVSSFHAILVANSKCIAIANERDKNEFGISNVLNESCLLLCPHITMLALLFANRAFATSSLTSSKHLFRLRIALEQKQLSIPLKEELAKRPLFRRCKSTVKGVQISNEKILANTTLRPQMNHLESIIDMKLPTDSYIFRRGNGQALDNSSK